LEYDWLQGLWGPPGWEPVQAAAGAAASSSRLPRDRADVGAAANTVVGASGRSRIFEWGHSPFHHGEGRRNFLKFLVLKYYGAF